MSKYDSGKVIKDIQHQILRTYCAKENLRIVLDGLQEEDGIAELCRREGSNQNVYYRWSKAFLKAKKQRMGGDTKREANSTEVTDLKQENGRLKHLLAELMLKNNVLKKSVPGADSTWEDAGGYSHHRRIRTLSAPDIA